MDDIAVVTGEKGFVFSGIGQEGKGLLSIAKDGKELEISNLTLKKRDLEEGRIDETFYHAIQTDQGEILIDKRTLNNSLNLIESGSERIEIRDKIALIAFQGNIDTIENRLCSSVKKTSAILTASWLKSHLPQLVSRAKDSKEYWVKERKSEQLPIPLYCHHDEKTGEISIQISTGVLIGGGNEKRIKEIIVITQGMITELVKLAPIKGEGNLERARQAVENDIQVTSILGKIGVPNMVQCYAISYKGKGVMKTTHMMERCKQDLFEELMKTIGNGDTVPANKLPLLLKHVLNVLDSLSSLHHIDPTPYVHRDLKLENVLVKREGETRLIDFGFMVKEGETGEMKGSPGYVAPEALKEHIANGAVTANISQDMWAVGAMLQTIVTGMDFLGELQDALGRVKNPVKEQEIMDRIDAKIKFDQKVLSRKGTPLDLLIRDLIDCTPENRPTAEQAYQRLGELLY